MPEQKNPASCGRDANFEILIKNMRRQHCLYLHFYLWWGITELLSDAFHTFEIQWFFFRHQPAAEPDTFTACASSHVSRDTARGCTDPIHAGAPRPAHSCAAIGWAFADVETCRGQPHQLPGMYIPEWGGVELQMYYTCFSLIIPLQILVFAICLVTAVAAEDMLLLPQSMLYSGNTAELACLRCSILLIALYV